MTAARLNEILHAESDLRPLPESGRISEMIREDIVEGRLPAGSRLKVGDLAQRYATSTNPIREALQQLRGEGFVLISHNRGARVRPIDEEFVRDTYEITALIEPFLTHWFAGFATDDDIAELNGIQAEIEALGFRDSDRHSDLDERFHRVVYNRHYNRHAVELWSRHREILKAISRNFPYSRARQQTILAEHRELIACLARHDADGAAAVVERHVRGSGRRIIDQMRANIRQAETDRRLVEAE